MLAVRPLLGVILDLQGRMGMLSLQELLALRSQSLFKFRKVLLQLAQPAGSLAHFAFKARHLLSSFHQLLVQGGLSLGQPFARCEAGRFSF